MNCTKCELYKNSRRPCLRGAGNRNTNLMIVGMNPGQIEDKTGIPFTGDSGKKLNEAFEKAKIKREDIYITNLCKCRTPSNREPTKEETDACIDYLKKEIKNIKPNIIVVLGNYVCKHLLGQTGIGKIHGKLFWNEEFKANIIVSVHPSRIVRNPTDKKYVDMLADDLKKAKEFSKHSGKVTKKRIKTNYIVCDTLAKVKTLFDRLLKTKEFSIDLETTCLNPKVGKIICAQFSWKEGTAAILPFCKDTNTYTDFWNQIDIETIKYKLKLALENPKSCKIFHNCKYEFGWLKYKLSIIPQGEIVDTMIAHYLINSTDRKHGLKELAYQFTDMGGYEKEVVRGREKGFKGIPIEKVWQYGGADSDCTLRIKHSFEKDIKPYSKIMQEILIPLSKVLADVELTGVKIDKAKVKELIEKTKPVLDNLEIEMAKFPQVKKYLKDMEAIKNKKKKKPIIPHSKQLEFGIIKKTRPIVPVKKKPIKKFGVNFKSSKQLSDILYTYIGLEPVEKSRKGTIYSTDSRTLIQLRHKHKIIGMILKYRALHKFYSTYLLALLEKPDEENRLHTEYRLTRTFTGRLSSKNPNLQNIPKKTFKEAGGKEIKLGKLVRECFIPDKNCVLIESDLKQIEFRILAHYCNDPLMIEDIRAGKDIHRILASVAFKKKPEDITSEERRKAKGITFGTPYGRGTKNISEDFKMTIEEAEQLVNVFFGRYKRCYNWIEAVKKGTKKHGYVKTIFGRKRLLPYINDEEERFVKKAEREAIATIIQSTASDILSTYTVNIYNRLNREGLKSKIILTIHDSLVLEVPKEEIDIIVALLKEEMTRPLFGLRIPIGTEVVIGENWGNTHEFGEDEEVEEDEIS